MNSGKGGGDDVVDHSTLEQKQGESKIVGGVTGDESEAAAQEKQLVPVQEDGAYEVSAI